MAQRKPDLKHAAQLLNSGAIHLLRRLRETDRSSGLTPARLSALSVVVFVGPQPLGRLAEAEGVAGPTMTRIVDGLSDLGLAERRPHPDSSRSVLVTATAKGERVMRAAAQARIDAISVALRSLPATQRAQIVAHAESLELVAAALGRR